MKLRIQSESGTAVAVQDGAFHRGLDVAVGRYSNWVTPKPAILRAFRIPSAAPPDAPSPCD